MSGAWKERERLVAKWWSTKRNPLSGRNNYNDAGEKRVGDILFENALVEIKRRKSVSLKLARETQKLAKEYKKKNWIIYEFQTGAAQIVRFTVDFATAESISRFLRTRWTPPTSVSDKGL
jgi:hypothetical protein